MASDGNSATSGGLLVILGIVVALGAVYIYSQYGHSGPSITVNVPDIAVKH